MIDLAHIYQYLRSTDGVNQFDRSLPALDTGFVGIDERRKNDFINFIRELSKEVNFYRSDNVKDGNWSAFFDLLDTGNTVLAKAATVEPLPSVNYSNGIGGFGATLTGSLKGALPAQDGIKLVDGDLLLVWQQIAALQNGVYEVKQGSGSSPFILTRSVHPDRKIDLAKQIVEIEEGEQNARILFIQKTLNPTIGVSDLIYFRGGPTRDDLSPHLALLLSFLRMNSIVQKDMNQLTGRHLTHYYEKVLRLQRRAARADQVHVVFELAKNNQQFLLSGGTLLDAGKTEDGKARQYALDSEIVVNNAIVESLKSSFADVNSAGNLIVFKADDATQVKTDATASSWRPFGQSQMSFSGSSKNMVEAELGFAIASPALQLAEGERTIKIEFDLQNNGEAIIADQSISHVFEITFTSDKEWSTPLTFTAEILTTSKLLLTSSFPSSSPSISPYNEAIHGPGYSTAWPVCRCLIRPDTFSLERLASFTISNISIEVEALGVKNLVLQNDESVQPAGKPSLPFGSIPVLKNNFYIGSKEAFSKSLKSLKLYLEWKDLPEDINDYYKGYDSPSVTADKFTAYSYLLAGKTWNNIFWGINYLFNSDTTDSVRTIEFKGSFFEDSLVASGYERDPDMTEFSSFDLESRQGFMKLVLTGPTAAEVSYLPAYAPFEAFGNKSFSPVFTKKAIALGTNPDDATIILPNPPFVPTLKSVALDYSAKETFFPSIPNGVDQFFMLDIFGIAEIQKNESALMVPVFPQEGALYIGLKNATPPQTVSFLFQVESGTVTGSKLLEKQDMHWSYLAGNQWQSLASGDIVEDATDAFQKPGIIRLNLGSNATATGNLMPAGLHWVRLSIDRSADGAGGLADVKAQAARATLITKSTDTVVQLIQPGTITRLVNKVAAIKSVKQDHTSFDGLSMENDASFFRRISERLHHRNRAVAGWDYERIVLEEFPDVFKVKCLPHTDLNNKIVQGNVKLVIVPDMRLRSGGDPLQPKDNPASLRKIETHVKEKYLGGFVIPHVVNPEYETLLVDCKVAFLAGFDPGFYANQLQDDIRRFLSPWAYEEGQDIIFGGKIYKSEILAFVEGRPYVDFVINFQLYHRYEGEGLPVGIGCMTVGVDFIVASQPKSTIGEDGTSEGATIGLDFVIGEPVEIAIATRPDAILVSNAEHRIEVLQDGSFVCSGVSNLGIGQMIIGLDFIPIT